MTTLFGRYVFRQVANAFVLILVTLTSIVWLATALRQLDLIISQGQGVTLFLKLTLLSLPSLMALIAPNAMLMAALYTLDRLNGDSAEALALAQELMDRFSKDMATVLREIGVSDLRIPKRVRSLAASSQAVDSSGAALAAGLTEAVDDLRRPFAQRFEYGELAIADPEFAAAISNFTEHERNDVAQTVDELERAKLGNPLLIVRHDLLHIFHVDAPSADRCAAFEEALRQEEILLDALPDVALACARSGGFGSAFATLGRELEPRGRR